jgi:hypothetical protein
MPFNLRYSTFKMSVLLAIATGLFSMQIQAEENLYAKNYKAQNNSQLRSLQQIPDTKIFVSNHKEEDNISMLEKGYDMMGSSGFEAGNVPADLALQHGKNIYADTVLVYSKYGASKTAESKMQAIKDAIKNKGEVTEQDIAQDPTVYQYYASYWAKLPTPLLGVHIIKLKQKVDPRQTEVTGQEESGLKVIAVVQASPAAKAAIMRGDALLKIGDVSLVKPEDLFAAVKRYAGTTVPMILQRNNENVATTVTLNSPK